MSLMQISEPGQSPDPHQRRLAIGIDLGTTNSLVGAVRNGVADVLPDEDGHALLPSAVWYRDGEGRPVVGAQALEAGVLDPGNVITSVKRLMGKGAGDVVEAALPYELVSDARSIGIRTAAGSKTPVEVSADILRALRERAERTLGVEAGGLHGAVITVPAYFDDAQRQATRAAAQLAGLEVLRLLNEPTAAAVAYGLDHRSEGVFAVFDLGGGTFDVSVLRLTRGVFEVIATAGDVQLGGDDFDAVLADAFSRDCGLGPTADWARAQPRRWRQLMRAARSAREALSTGPSAELQLDLGEGRVVTQTVDRHGLTQLAGDLIRRMLQICDGALDDAGLVRPKSGQPESGQGVSGIDGVVLVGGATRMPLVREAVERHFCMKPLVDLDPEQVVAIGAAKQADQLVGNGGGADGDWLLLDVLPLSLGLETMGGLVERIIPRNSTIPLTRAQEFTTYRDGQTAIALHVVQGERDVVDQCRSLARFELRDIEAAVAGAARVKVTFQVDADGLLSVDARDALGGASASVVVKPSYGLSDDEVGRMLADSFGSAREDARQRALREQRVDADRLLVATQSALTRDGDLLNSAERAGIDACMREMAGLLREPAESLVSEAEQDRWRNALHEATAALSAATDGFAEKRMDRAIGQALSGRRLDEIEGA